MGISDTLLRKTVKLDPPEYEIIKSHSVIASAILKDVDIFSDISQAIRHHHEHSDDRKTSDCAINEIDKYSGTQFDLEIVAMFRKIYKSIKIDLSEFSEENFDSVCKMELTLESALYSQEYHATKNIIFAAKPVTTFLTMKNRTSGTD